MTQKKSNDSTADQLESPEQWDLEHAELHPPVKNARVILSVAFPSQHFQIVARCAEQMGKKLSEFVREAALERVAREYGWAEFAHAGAGARSALVIVMVPSPATTRVGVGLTNSTGDVTLHAD